MEHAMMVARGGRPHLTLQDFRRQAGGSLAEGELLYGSFFLQSLLSLLLVRILVLMRSSTAYGGSPSSRVRKFGS